MDEIDREIMRLLRANARMSNAALGRLVDRKANAVRLRRKKLEDSGLIERYTVNIPREKTAYVSFYYILVSLKSNNRSIEKSFEAKIKPEQDILFCDGTQGRTDYIIYAGNSTGNTIKDLVEKIQSMDEVKLVRSIRAVSVVKTYDVNFQKLIPDEY